MCQFCRPLENLLQRDRHPAVLRPFLPFLTKFHSKSKPLLGRCYQKPLAAAIRFHRAWEASGLFPDKLKKFEREIENLQKEVENHEEILVNLQGYGSGIGRWGSLGPGRSKASSKGSKRKDGGSRSKRRVPRSSGREAEPDRNDGHAEAAASEDSRSSSRRTEDGEEEEEEEEEEGEEDVEEDSGPVNGRNAPAQDAAHVSRPRVSTPRHRDVSGPPPRSAMRRAQRVGVVTQQPERAQPAGAVKPEPEVSNLITPLTPGPESPKTIKKEKPRFHFRKGVKAYINELFDYKVDELVDMKVETRLALERTMEPSRAPASGVSKRNVTFPEGVKPADLSSPGAKRPGPSKPNSKRPVTKVAQPDRPTSSRARQSSPYRARQTIHPPALYRVGNTRKGDRSSTPESAVHTVVDVEPKVGNPDAEGRGEQEEEWVDDVEEETINKNAENEWNYINEVAGVVEEGASNAASRVPNRGSPDADDGVYQDIRSMARIRDFGQAPDAAAFTALHATVEDDMTSDGGSVDPVRLVRDLWPNLATRQPDPAPRRPLNKRHGFVNLRTV